MASYQRPVFIQTFQKGRGLAELLGKFEPLLFPDQQGIAQTIIDCIEESKQAVKAHWRSNDSEYACSQLVEYYTADERLHELKGVFTIEPDYRRKYKPDRVMFKSIDTVMYGKIPIRLIGDLNPFDNCRDNLVPIAIANSDLVANRLLRELRRGSLNRNFTEDKANPQAILDLISKGGIETTVSYEMLNINESRMMMFAGISPSELRNQKYYEKGMPKLNKGTQIYIDGQYWFLMKSIFGEKRLEEVKDVEAEVFFQEGRWGAYIVGTGKTLRNIAKSGYPLSVVRKPLFTSRGALFFNPLADDRMDAVRAVGLIKEFNQQLTPSKGYDIMCKTLEDYLIGPKK